MNELKVTSTIGLKPFLTFFKIEVLPTPLAPITKIRNSPTGLGARRPSFQLARLSSGFFSCHFRTARRYLASSSEKIIEAMVNRTTNNSVLIEEVARCFDTIVRECKVGFLREV